MKPYKENLLLLQDVMESGTFCKRVRLEGRPYAACLRFRNREGFPMMHPRGVLVIENTS